MGKETLYESLKTAIKHKRLLDINVKAIDAGYQFGSDNQAK
jgi:Pyruvate/2-oxoacid:ferredoxin oxidoreductase gamma subunit